MQCQCADASSTVRFKTFFLNIACNSIKMKLLILIASCWALVACKPELYKEKRVRRDINFDQLGDNLEKWGQQTEDKLSHGVDDLSHNLENLGQQTQDKFEESGDPQKLSQNLGDLGKNAKNTFSQGLEGLSQGLQGLSHGMKDFSDGLTDFGRQTDNKVSDLSHKLGDQWELDHSNRQSHWNEDLDHKSNFGSLGQFGQGMQSHFGDMDSLGKSHFGERSPNQWDSFGDLGQNNHFGDLGRRTPNQWDNMGNFNREQHSHFGNLDNFGQSHFGQQTENRWDRLNDFNRRTDSHW